MSVQNKKLNSKETYEELDFWGRVLKVVNIIGGLILILVGIFFICAQNTFGFMYLLFGVACLINSVVIKALFNGFARIVENTYITNLILNDKLKKDDITK